jgi:D-beta-D-heptose 7-phosphate kinase/D-beta-D-heptose 1-phosphate adenosyltransferase
LGARDAALLANRAAGIVVAKVGTAVAYPGEILNDSHEERFAAAETKVATAAEAVDRVARWRKAGRRVGFTNGCFDLLHPGHVSLIAQARAACDRLIVGLNSDASVQRLKGESRPVQSESARANVLAALGDVDLVVVFGEDTPLELIRALEPDVLVKGADYTEDAVVGADMVKARGGRVLLATLVDGQSTTGTIARMGKS